MLKNFLKQEWLKNLVIVLFLGLIISVAFWGFLKGNILDEDDVAFYYIPAFKFYSESLQNQESFYVAPNIFSGFPLYLSQVGGFYDPINFLLFKFFSFITAYHIRIVINYWLAAIFVYFFARALSLSRTAAVVAAFAYISAQNPFFGLNILRSNSFFLMPGLFYILQKLHEKPDRRIVSTAFFVIFGSVIFGLSLLAGYTQLNLYSMIAVGFFFLYLCRQRFSWKFFFLAILSLGGGVLIFFPQLNRILEFVPLTGRAGGISWEEALGGQSFPRWLAETIKTSMVPLISAHAGYVKGSLAFLLIFFLGPLKRNKITLFFIGLLLFSLLSAMPYPLFWLMHQLPLFEYFRFPVQWVLVASFSLSMLAGLGYQTASLHSKFSAFVKPIVVVPILAFYFSMPIFILAWDKSLEVESFLKTPWVAQEIHQRSVPESFRFYNFYPGDMQWYLLVRPFNPPRQVISDYQQEFVHSHLSPFLWDIPSIRGFDMFVPRRYDKVLGFLEREKLEDLAVPKEAKIDEMRLNISSNKIELLGMMNVRFLLSMIQLPESLHDQVKIVNKLLIPEYEIIATLYENKRFLSRVFSPHQIIVLKENEDNFNTIIEKEHDFYKKGFIECDECPLETLKQSPVAIEIHSVKNDLISFRTKAAEDVWVIVSNSHIPRWHAFVDGKETPLYYANYIYQGLRVPAGEHEVVIRYIP